MSRIFIRNFTGCTSTFFGIESIPNVMKKVLKLYPDFNVVLCPDYVISTARQMTNLLSNFEYLLLLYFLIAAEF
jgi:hypothetical protein